MITLPLDAKDEDVLHVVRAWVELLAQEKYDEAFAMLCYASGEAYAPGEDWTPELVRTLITNYGSIEPYPDGRTFHVTSLHSNPALLDGKFPAYQDVEWWEERKGCVGLIHFDLPINGEFSDLTAIFNIMKVGERLALELHDIHVL